MGESRLRLRTYNQVWRLERMIYRIERLSLPFPVTITQIGVFAGGVAIMAVLSLLRPVGMLPATVRYALVPGLATWVLTRHSLDGKPPHIWLLTMMGYIAAPTRLAAFQPLPRPRRLRVRFAVACRTGRNVGQGGDGDEVSG